MINHLSQSAIYNNKTVITTIFAGNILNSDYDLRQVLNIVKKVIARIKIKGGDMHDNKLFSTINDDKNINIDIKNTFDKVYQFSSYSTTFSDQKYTKLNILRQDCHGHGQNRIWVFTIHENAYYYR